MACARCATPSSTRGCARRPPGGRSTSPPAASCPATSSCTRTCSVPDVLRLVRAHNLLLAALGVLAGGWIALGSVPTPGVLWFASLAAIGFGAAGNALNDIWDRAGERVNRPGGERPLAAGRLARGTADLCVVAGALVGVAAAALVNGAAVLIGAAALVVMIAYSPLLKRRGLPGNVAVALVAGLPLLYGAIAVDRPAAGAVPWAPAARRHPVGRTVTDPGGPAGDR